MSRTQCIRFSISRWPTLLRSGEVRCGGSDSCALLGLKYYVRAGTGADFGGRMFNFEGPTHVAVPGGGVLPTRRAERAAQQRGGSLLRLKLEDTSDHERH